MLPNQGALYSCLGYRSQYEFSANNSTKILSPEDSLQSVIRQRFPNAVTPRNAIIKTTITTTEYARTHALNYTFSQK